ncbi:glycosyltransferase [Lactobacillus delbrueckii subsp. bulgaricus]|nr:glycosyltransferase [Lactobacillus delbrueckii subsp. bulgaricus]MBT8946011.1 glycosyltransferase [Lactobacillus delbrueckii subsp. bulgaricus]MBT8953754.1 glycosyltransferase [Lactobacillus delbrueckii subsp. bulgaricus]MBT8955458.1 glycosyltransferase [Lactobacillus delbrueckii subsp. bulgaricus]MBT8956933.1 glycosyltransferase [Lactobacillus delbrueckii subsp. bulgaricus]
MQKIRVVHVAEAAGGVERYLYALLKNSDSQKIENYLIASQHYEMGKFKKYVSGEYQLQMAHAACFKNDKATVKQIKKIVKQIKPDIVYAHSTKAGALTRIALMGMHIPVIYNPHGWAFNMAQSKKKELAYRLIEKAQIPFTKKVVCISEAEMQSAMQKHICSKDKIKIIPNGIDFDLLDKVQPVTRRDLGIPEDAFVVGQIGRLSEQKSPDVFVEMAEKIKKEIPNSFFVMVGDGNLEAEIRRLIKSKGLEDSFLITGWVDNPTGYLNCFDVATLLSRWEGFGLALVEYMYCGVPLVSTKVDAIPYVVDEGIDGLLVEPNSANEAAQAAIRIYGDSVLAAKLVTNGFNIAKYKYDIRRVIKQTQQLYQDVLSRSL